MGSDGRPTAFALFGLNVAALPPGRVVLRVEYVSTPEQFASAKAGVSKPSALQVAMRPEEIRDLARFLSEAATAAEAMEADWQRH